MPGNLQEKVDPYLRPLYDALYDMLDADKVEKLLERAVIEVAPIAFMRGRTLNDSFIILDEAQNSTAEQMKMVLTRQGFNSKMVVTGDLTQVDLPSGKRSGLNDAVEVLRGIEGISFVYFDERDVVRHPLVQKIVKAYERHQETIGGRQLALKLTDPAAEAASAVRRNRSPSRQRKTARSHWSKIWPCLLSRLLCYSIRPRRACRGCAARAFAKRLESEVTAGVRSLA